MPGVGIKGFGLGEAGSGDMPTAPTISVTAGENQVTVTVTGSDAGVTNYIKYKAPSDTSWQDGGSRSGDGDVTVTDLANDVPYIFIAWSEDGVVSMPAVAVPVTLAETYENQFDEQLVDDASIYLETFGETINYLPRGGGTRAILAIINRKQPGPLGSAPKGLAPVTDIWVANDSSSGISASELDTGGDKVELAVRRGQIPQQRNIKGPPIAEDAGLMQLEVR